MAVFHLLVLRRYDDYDAEVTVFHRAGQHSTLSHDEKTFQPDGSSQLDFSQHLNFGYSHHHLDAFCGFPYFLHLEVVEC